MNFREIATRLTGISCPVFGVSWNPPEAERTVARRVIAYLEDRRVLYNPGELEVPEHCVESVLEMRRYLTQELQHLDPKQEIAANLMAMRGSCRKFLDGVEVNHPRWHFAHAGLGGYAAWVFISALGELRGVFGIHLARLAASYGLDVEDDLAAILPGRDIEGESR